MLWLRLASFNFHFRVGLDFEPGKLIRGRDEAFRAFHEGAESLVHSGMILEHAAVIQRHQNPALPLSADLDVQVHPHGFELRKRSCPCASPPRRE